MNQIKLANETILNRVAYGALRLPAIHHPDKKSWDKSVVLLRRAISLGVNLIDTAHFYGNGIANRLIHEALHPYADSLVIATKVGVIKGEDGRPQPGAEPKHIRSVVEDDLRSLSLEQLPLVFLRLPGGPLKDTGVPLAESLGELVKLKSEGKIKNIGLSSATVHQLGEALKQTPIAAIQNLFNLSNQRSRDVLERCILENIVFLPYFPLQMGQYKQTTAKLQIVENIAKTHQCTTAQVILAWLLALSPQVVVIPGTSSVEHLEENMASTRIELTELEIKSLTET